MISGLVGLALLPVALVALELLTELHFRWLQWRHNCSSPAYASSFPLGLRAAIRLFKNYRENRLNEYTQEQLKMNGNMTARQQTVTRTILITVEPDNVKALLATQFKHFDLGDRLNIFHKLLGKGIFTLSGTSWYHSRQALRPQFQFEQVSRLTSLEEACQDLIALVHEKSSKGYFDMQELFFMLTLDTATEFLFGESTDSLSGGKRLTAERAAAAAEFQYSFNRAQEYLLQRTILQKLYFVLDNKEFTESCDSCHRFVDYYVNQTLDEYQQGKIQDKEQNGGKYVFIKELTKDTTDPIVLRDQALNIALAGRDTTAGTLSFALALLVRHKQVWTKLRQAILTDFGTGTENINFHTLKRCDYLKYVINEVLRLYPIVPMNFRQATQDTTLPKGGGPNEDQPIFIPKGTQIYYNTYTMHRHEKLWGPDAEEFKPERWENMSGSQVSWKYLPFNGGPRICLGQQYALTEISYVLVRLCQTFEDVNCAPKMAQEPIKQKSTLTSAVVGGVKVQFVPASY